MKTAEEYFDKNFQLMMQEAEGINLWHLKKILAEHDKEIKDLIDKMIEVKIEKKKQFNPKDRNDSLVIFKLDTEIKALTELKEKI